MKVAQLQGVWSNEHEKTNGKSVFVFYDVACLNSMETKQFNSQGHWRAYMAYNFKVPKLIEVCTRIVVIATYWAL